MSKYPDRKERDFWSIHQDRMRHLGRCYIEVVNGKGRGEGLLFAQFWTDVHARDDPALDSELKILARFPASDDISGSEEFSKELVRSPIILAVVYLMRASSAYQYPEQENLAWSYLADGCYWTGVAAGCRWERIAKLTERRKVASKGAQGRGARYRPVKDLAIRLLRSKMPPERWEGFFEAAKGVDEEVNDFAVNKCKLEAVALTTIAEWFSKLPDNGVFFQEKRRRNK